MNKTRTLLISGLATMTLIITLIETGFLNLESQPLIAQEDASGLTLEKDGEQVLIPLEEWVVVSSAYDPSNTLGGLYMGMTVDALRIQEKGEPFEREIPIDEIGSVFTGKTKSTRDYVFQGMKVAGIGTMGFGMLMGTSLGLANEAGVGESLLCGAMVGVFYSIFTVPAGALIGFLRGQAAQGKVVEYVIGEDEWRIVKQ
ncbi:MAG: hypothetical protein HN927_07750 [Candidatus Marinimicrobia bacterium]|jgi:hypothetical protein|nr:hypothetical protein [Candidatus Neomarinimicrobiota bacterium]MBT5386715.1 hypothetical protein [Candidatus Neomarinimicrobiota bacterium]MBT5996499.1 hypothetical protein [Candidatus Neomarinimicrobiota bacterium]MBT6782266.1 hypothetical protein [Candidatus Neomarinimicrobiota bacterium]MBT7084128.1 hypothetical protein [Candidatus Neomarinimicrobiota bacterium]